MFGREPMSLRVVFSLLLKRHPKELNNGSKRCKHFDVKSSTRLNPYMQNIPRGTWQHTRVWNMNQETEFGSGTYPMSLRSSNHYGQDQEKYSREWA